jgi:hypothetical protein
VDETRRRTHMTSALCVHITHSLQRAAIFQHMTEH